MRYTVVLLPDPEGGYVAHVPAIPGCVTEGETVEEAVAMAVDAAEALLAIAADSGEELPIEEPGAVVASIDVAVRTLAAAT